MGCTVEQLFSYDLMRFIMNENNIRWFPKCGSYYDRGNNQTTFLPIIGEVVYKLSFKKSILKRKELKKLIKEKSKAEGLFDDLKERAAFACFSNGFSMWNFLMYCTYITTLAVEYFKIGRLDIAELTVASIACILIDNSTAFDAEGSWKSLTHECAWTLRNTLCMRSKCTLMCWFLICVKH